MEELIILQNGLRVIVGGPTINGETLRVIHWDNPGGDPEIMSS